MRGLSAQNEVVEVDWRGEGSPGGAEVFEVAQVTRIAEDPVFMGPFSAPRPPQFQRCTSHLRALGRLRLR